MQVLQLHFYIRFSRFCSKAWKLNTGAAKPELCLTFSAEMAHRRVFMAVTPPSSLVAFPPLLTAAEADKIPGLLQGANPDYAHSHRLKKICLGFFNWWNKGLSDLNSELTCTLLTWSFLYMYSIWISLSFSSPTWDITGMKPQLRPSDLLKS